MWALGNAQRATAAWLLAPYSVDDFLSEYFERKPLYIPRNIAGFYDRYFSLQEMDRALHTSRLRARDLKLFRDGTPIRPDLYTLPPKALSPDDTATDIVCADRASALFASGCTMTLTSVANFSSPAAELNRSLEAFFKCGINANVYLTPRGNQGFAVHYDTHDTLIIQISGRKHWLVYPPTSDLPLDHQYYNRKENKPQGEPMMELELKPGDLLYLPRGYCHEAKAHDDMSLHVTFGFFPARWAQVLTSAITTAAETDVRLRRYASPGAAAAALAQILPEILTQQALEQSLATIQAGFLTERRNGLGGQTAATRCTRPAYRTFCYLKAAEYALPSIADGARHAVVVFRKNGAPGKIGCLDHPRIGEPFSRPRRRTSVRRRQGAYHR